MHNFFLERFLQPADWFEKRLAYTRSVAASSMVRIVKSELLPSFWGLCRAARVLM